MNKLRWAKWFWADWSDDPALALCSLAAQGLWMRLMCIAAQGTPYGSVSVNGKPPSIEELAKLVRVKEPQRVARLISELERKGVVARDPDSTLFSRRMRTDWDLNQARSGPGFLGALKTNQRFAGDFAAARSRITEAEAYEGGTPPSTPIKEEPLNPHELRSRGLSVDKIINGRKPRHEPRGLHVSTGGDHPTAQRASGNDTPTQDAPVADRPRRRPLH